MPKGHSAWHRRFGTPPAEKLECRTDKSGEGVRGRISCPWCERRFKPTRNSQRFCSLKCGKTHWMRTVWNERRRQRRLARKIAAARTCKRCGRPISVTRPAHTFFCSKKCRPSTDRMGFYNAAYRSRQRAVLLAVRELGLTKESR